VRFPLDPDENVYKAGIAVGLPDIKNDEITFRFKKELFSIPTYDAVAISYFNGYFYEAKIAKLRALVKAKH